MFLQIKSIRQMLGYVVGSLLVIVGIVITSGLVIVKFLPSDRIRITFGVVLTLYGIFRFVSAHFSEKRDTIVEDDSWKGPSSNSSKKDISSSP